LLRRHTSLVKRRRVDQIAHRFRLRQIDPPIQIGAQCELARLCHSRTRFQRALYSMP